MALEITNKNIADILTTNKITVIDFWAPWCGPCKMLGEIISGLALDNVDVAIGKVNVDENSEIAVKYSIKAIPTVIFFKNGEEVDKIIGIKSKSEFQEKINSLK